MKKLMYGIEYHDGTVSPSPLAKEGSVRTKWTVLFMISFDPGVEHINDLHHQQFLEHSRLNIHHMRKSPALTTRDPGTGGIKGNHVGISQFKSDLRLANAQ
jgi:hypothetical protein